MTDPLEQTPEQQADAMAGSGLRTIMRRALPASAKPGFEEKTAPPFKLSAETPDEDYAALSPGMRFVGPDGQTRTKPWEVREGTEEEDYDLVPEGKVFIDPTGKTRTKPAYQDVDLTASTLYHMSVNDKERRKALERSYPGKVQQDTQGRFYVDDEGVRRRPKNTLESPTGIISTVGGAGGPMAGSALGEVGGAVVGGPVGAVAGAGLGGALGQGLNDLILKYAGVYDRSAGEEALNLGEAGAFGAAGSAVGRVAGATLAGAGGAKAVAKSSAPGVAARFLGADKESLQTSLRIAEEGEHESSSKILRAFGMTDPGTPVPISAWAHHAPMLQIEHEVLHPRFHMEEPLKQGRTAFMEKQGTSLLGDLGAKVEGSLTEPLAAVSGREAGQMAIDRALQESSARETALRMRIGEQKAAAGMQAQAALPEYEARLAALRDAGQQADAAATKVVDAGYKAIEKDAENAMRAAKAGHNSGDFWQSVAEKFKDIRGMIGVRASGRYAGWRESFGEIVPEQGGLAEDAKAFLDELPKPFQENHPSLIKRIAQLAGKQGRDGKWVREPVTLDLASAHELRSLFRHNIDWTDLPSDARNGALKLFQGKLDSVIHGANVPLAARKGLDDIDKWYGKVMPIWNDKRIQAVVDGIRNGQPADPKELVEMMIKEGNTDFNNKLRRMLGPNLWSGIKGAYSENLIRKNRDLWGNVNGTSFARDVLSDYNSGLLKSIHGEEGAAKLRQQAQYAALLDGKMPVPTRQGDTTLDIIERARQVQTAIEKEAEKNPIGLLKDELKRLSQEERQLEGAERRATQRDPFKFLIDKSVGASKAADKIASSEDLIIGYAARVGENSPEWEAMKQFIAKRIFTDTVEPKERFKKISPEVSELVLRTKLQDAQRLAKDMEFLRPRTDAGAGTSMLATSKVTRPFGSGVIGKTAQVALKPVGGGPVARGFLDSYYDLLAKLMESPSTMRWVMKGLEGNPQSREIVKAQIQRWMQKSGPLGAATGESQYQAGSEGLPQPQENQQGGKQIPQFAEGGIVTEPTVAMVGERGPEAVVPLDDPAAAQQAADVAAARSRAPYAKANARESGLPQVLDYFGNRVTSAVGAPYDALHGAFSVIDPETGMPTPEAIQRGKAVAGMAMTSGMPLAQRGAAGMAGGKLGGADRVNFRSAGAQREEGGTKSISKMTDEEVKEALARSQAYQARLKERLAAKAKEPVAPDQSLEVGGDRLGFASLGTRKEATGLGDLRQAYKSAVQDNGGISSVYISDLAKKSGLSLESVKRAIAEAARRGEVSIHQSSVPEGRLSPEQIEGAIQVPGESPYHTVRFK
jgi:hypothetical protein